MSDDLKLHPNAAKNFNCKAEQLVEHAGPVSPVPVGRGGMPLDRPIKAHIGPDDMVPDIPTRMRFVMPLSGETVESGVTVGNRMVGVKGDRCQELRKLASAIVKTPVYRDVLSLDTVEGLLVEWVVDQHAGYGETPAFADFLYDKVRNLVKERTVWIPIAELHLESAHQVGRVEITPMTQALFDGWARQCGEEYDNLNALRDSYQGWCAGVATVVADSNKAMDLVRGWTRDAVAVLRMFHPAAFTSSATCYTDLMGKAPIQANHALVCEGNLLRQTYSSLAVKAPLTAWPLPDPFVHAAFDAGLGILSRMLRDDNLSKFERDVLAAVFLHSAGTTRPEMSDRLVYLLAALESLFVRNENEPIVSNLSERLAFLIRSDQQGRIDLARLVKSVYAHRSRFVHHGQSVEDSRELSEFLMAGWTALLELVRRVGEFRSRDELSAHLDDLKWR